MKECILVIFGVLPFLIDTNYAFLENYISLEDSEVVNVTSPSYPNDYDNNADILWMVIAPPGNRVMLHFMDLEIDDVHDYVTIFEGRTPEFEEAVQRIHISGSTRPPNITSVGSYLWLRFTSDLESNGKGFKAILSYIHIRDILLTIMETANITSPNYPNEYDINADILWRVTAPSGYRVVLHFKDFNTQEYQDNVTVFEGRGPEFEMSVKRIHESGSTIPSNITSVGSYLWLRFISDGQSMLSTHTGFSAQLLLAYIPEITLNNPETVAEVTSPNFPQEYDNYADILWRVKAPADYRVLLHFTALDTEVDSDFVTIYEGRVPDLERSTRRSRNSGHDSPLNITSIGSYLWIRFTSDRNYQADGNINYTGFRVLLSSVPIPGILLTISKTTNLTSPKFPQPYDSDTDILWKVIAPSGERVMVTFSAFKTESGYDFVTIYEGRTNGFEEAVERSKLSGPSLPDNITSVGSYVWLRFTSAGELESCTSCSGFMAMIGTVPIRVSQSTPSPTTVADTSSTTTTTTTSTSVGRTLAVGILLACVTLYGIIITVVYFHLRRSHIALKQSVSDRLGDEFGLYTSLDATMEQPAYDDTIATRHGSIGHTNAIDGVEYENQKIVKQTAIVQKSNLSVADENTEPEYEMPIGN